MFAGGRSPYANALALSTSWDPYSGGAPQVRRRVRPTLESKRHTGRCEGAPVGRHWWLRRIGGPLTDPRERSIEVGDEACASPARSPSYHCAADSISASASVRTMNRRAVAV